MRTRLFSFVAASIVLAAVIGCKGDAGPAGPSFTGNWSGFVTLVQSDGSRSADMSGASVAIDGTSFNTTTDSTGKWTLTGVSTGTYTLTISKAGYATLKETGRQFVGGATLYDGKATLAQPPNFTVTIDPVKTVTDSNSVNVVGIIAGGGRIGIDRVLIVIGSGPDVSASDPTKYVLSSTYTTSGTAFSIRFYKSDFAFGGFTSGEIAYIVAYPLSYGSNLEYTSYLDPATGRTVYTSTGAPSAVIPVTVP